MTLLKFFLVELKMFKRCSAFRVIPGIAQEHAADVPEDSANGRQSRFSLCAVNREV